MLRWLFIALLLTGCMVGPNYRRPAVEIPAAYHYETPEDIGSLNMEWWEQFGDPVLVALIQEALYNNKELGIAAGNIEAALGLLIETRAPLFPQIGYAGSYDRTQFSSSNLTDFSSLALPISIPTRTTTWQAILTGSWEIDLWGRIRRQVEAARANLNASCAAGQGVLLSLVTAVANGYITLRGLDEQLAISTRTMESYLEEVVYFEAQFKYGQTSEMSVAQAKTQYETAAAQIPQIKAQIVQAENALCILLGSNPRPIPRGKSIYNLQLPQVPAAIPSEILYQRPDIVGAEQNLIAANALIGAAKALYFPSISLTGFYGGSSPQLRNLFTGPANTWNFTGSVTGPIFTAGAIAGQVIQAYGNEKAALYTYEQTIQGAFADVETAFSTHTMITEQLASETKLVEAAGLYEYLALLQYHGGYSPYFVVIQAQEQYFPAQLTWAKTRAQQFISIVNIYQALGGGWVCLAGALPPAPPLKGQAP